MDETVFWYDLVYPSLYAALRAAAIDVGEGAPLLLLRLDPEAEGSEGSVPSYVSGSAPWPVLVLDDDEIDWESIPVEILGQHQAGPEAYRPGPGRAVVRSSDDEYWEVPYGASPENLGDLPPGEVRILLDEEVRDLYDAELLPEG